MGPLLFNIFINDIFYFANKAKLTNYADKTTVYLIKEHREILLKMLETVSRE